MANKRTQKEYIENDERWSAHNYHPIPVVLEKAEGVYVWDTDGKRYIDCLSAYSAVNQGHRHPKIIEAAKKQLDILTLTSRAFHNNKFGDFMKHLCEVAGYEVALPMNTGAEAVETAVKCARRWGYEIKNVLHNQAEIIVCKDNFHGRTTTIVGFSTDPDSYLNYGPATPGFKAIPYDNPEALEKAITPNTVAFLVEPIQGEAGVKVPSAGYLKKVRDICNKNNVLLILDEIQTGFCRTGKMFCSDHEGVKGDILCVGKALGGGIMPISAILSRWEIMKVFTPGTHGSTFGGNPMACAIGDAALDVLVDEKLADHAMEQGTYFKQKLEEIMKKSNGKIKEVRGKGLLLAIELDQAKGGKARPYNLKLMENGVLAKETHEYSIRLAPPLVISKEDIDYILTQLKKVFDIK